MTATELGLVHPATGLTDEDAAAIERQVSPGVDDPPFHAPGDPCVRLAWLGGCTRTYPVTLRDVLQGTVEYWNLFGTKMWIEELPAGEKP